MTFPHRPPASPRLSALLLILASLGILGTALLFQYVGGLFPCQLCIWQRWAYVAAIVPLLPALLPGQRPAFRGLMLALGGLAFLAGTGIAFFHVGVEQHWWPGLSSCSGAAGAATLDDLRAQLLEAPLVQCDQIAWSLLGISMAGWNALLSLILAGIALAAALTSFRRSA